jgi:hypothetical protein
MWDESTGEAPAADRPKWLKRLGAAAFLFFFVKGLLWLTVPVLILWFGVAAP